MYIDFEIGNKCSEIGNNGTMHNMKFIWLHYLQIQRQRLRLCEKGNAYLFSSIVYER